MRRGVLLLCLVCLGLAEDAVPPVWDWLPRATDDDRLCELHLAAAPGWTAGPVHGLDSRYGEGQLILRFEPRQVPAFTLSGPDGARLGIRLVAPGLAAGLASDPDGRLHIGADLAILAVPRREGLSDRRWGVLRLFESSHPGACSQRLDEPASAALGCAALTRQIVAAQELRPKGDGVLVVLSGEDRFVGWKHREYRQALSWLVADLVGRGATRVVLVEPSCPQIEEPLLAGLRAQVREVARVHRCPIVDTTSLGQDRFWELAPGVLGTALNDAGRQAREQLLGRGGWLPGG